MAGLRARGLDDNQLLALAAGSPPLGLDGRRLYLLDPLDVLDEPTPAARAVNALLTRLCVRFIVVMTRHTPDPRDPVKPLLAWFNAAASKHQHDVAEMIEGLGDAYWNLPTSRRWAARRLVKMWEKDGAAGFRDLSASLVNRPPGASL